MESATLGTSPLVLLIVPPDAHHQHMAILTAAGFRVVSQADNEATVESVLDLAPTIVVAELSGTSTDPMFGLVHRLKDDLRARDIRSSCTGRPDLRPIEQTAHAGAMCCSSNPRRLQTACGRARCPQRRTSLPAPFTVRRS